MASLFGVVIQTLKTETQPDGIRTLTLHFGDHWLRRFGMAEYLELDGEKSAHLRRRPEADEILIVLKGSITLELFDRRPDSPTHGQSNTLKMTAPSRVLIPFGVAAGWRSLIGQVEMLRLATHSETESAIERIPWEEL